MSVLVIRHASFEHLGHFASTLDANGTTFCYRDILADPQQQVAPEDYSALIVMGGPMSANDALPGIARELDLIERAIRAGMPVLGVCLGAQLIAKAVGARVYRNPRKEIGWAPVYFTEAGRADPLFRGFESPTTFLHWHSETFDLPAGAEWLAYSDLCRHQAYRYGKNVYGLQFHPEVTPEMIEDWCAQPANRGDVDAPDVSRLRSDPRAFDLAPMARAILDRWFNGFK
ncbi:MAG: type 1 glutamine amidotransferase [Bryobacteraceae bacterium]